MAPRSRKPRSHSCSASRIARGPVRPRTGGRAGRRPDPEAGRSGASRRADQLSRELPGLPEAAGSAARAVARSRRTESRAGAAVGDLTDENDSQARTARSRADSDDSVRLRGAPRFRAVSMSVAVVGYHAVGCALARPPSSDAEGPSFRSAAASAGRQLRVPGSSERTIAAGLESGCRPDLRVHLAGVVARPPSTTLYGKAARVVAATDPDGDPSQRRARF